MSHRFLADKPVFGNPSDGHSPKFNNATGRWEFGVVGGWATAYSLDFTAQSSTAAGVNTGNVTIDGKTWAAENLGTTLATESRVVNGSGLKLALGSGVTPALSDTSRNGLIWTIPVTSINADWRAVMGLRASIVIGALQTNARIRVGFERVWANSGDAERRWSMAKGDAASPVFMGELMTRNASNATVLSQWTYNNAAQPSDTRNGTHDCLRCTLTNSLYLFEVSTGDSSGGAVPADGSMLLRGYGRSMPEYEIYASGTPTYIRHQIWGTLVNGQNILSTGSDLRLVIAADYNSAIATTPTAATLITKLLVETHS